MKTGGTAQEPANSLIAHNPSFTAELADHTWTFDELFNAVLAM